MIITERFNKQTRAERSTWSTYTMIIAERFNKQTRTGRPGRQVDPVDRPIRPFLCNVLRNALQLTIQLSLSRHGQGNRD
jgi:hypothetical protein